MQIPSSADVREAQQRLDGLVRRTPVMSVSAEAVLGDQAVESGATFFLKLELMQHSGSFKARGASNYIASMPIAEAGVVAASGGNHGAAVAWAARRAGHAATIFVPTISAPAKVERLRSYGADVRQVGSVYADALEESMQYQRESGATSIHAYNHPAVMAGAGTTGLEFVEQVDGLDTMLVACGGGGLAGGIACAVGADVSIVVCETETTNAYVAAVAAGHPVDVTVSGLAADALGATQIGALAWEALSTNQPSPGDRAREALPTNQPSPRDLKREVLSTNHPSPGDLAREALSTNQPPPRDLKREVLSTNQPPARSITVTDEELAEARSHLWNEFRIVVEPSAAVTVAALRSGKYLPDAGERIGILLCGANTGELPGV